jgi:hypothetical protein
MKAHQGSGTSGAAGPARGLPVRFDASQPPTLFIVVDTEEEFNWAGPFSRDHTSVTAIARLGVLQDVFDRVGVRPTYAIDYPVATRPESVRVIRGLYESGRCDIGAHLHPWVTPPFDEDVNRRNSFACNLHPALERAKLEGLTTAVAENIGIRPVVYKAGRYGLGAATVESLRALDYTVDTSINPLMDYSAEGGPNFEGFDARPFFFSDAPDLLEIPCTHGFAGFARRAGLPLHRAAGRPPLARLRMTGVLSRSGALNKIMLSPETSTLAEMCAVARALLADGLRTFTLTLHSPSVEPGHTPYVRTASERERLLGAIEAFCTFFREELGGRTSTAREFRSSLLSGGIAA